MSCTRHQSSHYTSITPLLKNLRNTQTRISANDIAHAFSLIFQDALSPAQAATFLTLLSLTSRDKEADVLAACADRMRKAAYPVDLPALKNMIQTRRVKQGTYHGGLVHLPASNVAMFLMWISSVISSVRVAPRSRHTTSAPPPRSLPLPSFSCPNMAIERRPPSPAQPTSSPPYSQPRLV